mmetsp:Transcript_33912/g.85096  ORF Transcript_33912/g.85096 Transcript_33912/m.85096 type:complete len:202 (+) Transcript_33912:727-1332(+)
MTCRLGAIGRLQRLNLNRVVTVLLFRGVLRYGLGSTAMRVLVGALVALALSSSFDGVATQRWLETVAFRRVRLIRTSDTVVGFRSGRRRSNIWCYSWGAAPRVIQLLLELLDRLLCLLKFHRENVDVQRERISSLSLSKKARRAISVRLLHLCKRQSGDSFGEILAFLLYKLHRVCAHLLIQVSQPRVFLGSCLKTNDIHI